MSDDELKLTRRLFLQHTAMASAMTAGLSSIALKTDAMAQPPKSMVRTSSDGTSPYPYLDPPSPP